MNSLDVQPQAAAFELLRDCPGVQGQIASLLKNGSQKSLEEGKEEALSDML